MVIQRWMGLKIIVPLIKSMKQAVGEKSSIEIASCGIVAWHAT
jgi:hypothetical protein